MMKTIHIILFCALWVLAGCEGGYSVRHLPHLGDTPYQEDTIMVTYGTNPKRALTLLDSALLLGNISEYRSQFIRARIYSMSLEDQRLDSALFICEALLNHDSVRNNPCEQENIFNMLIATSRAKYDYEQYMYWATQKAELCQQQGEEIERWRTEADIGLVMTHLRQENEGLAKLDDAISHLDSPGSIDRMDAFIVAVKRKINALNDLQRYSEVIPLGQRILDRLDHYEQHVRDYAEDSYRLSWSDNPCNRDHYLDFCRAQANGFIARAYAMINEKEKAKEHLALFNQSDYGQTFMGHRMIAPTLMALGMYDEAMETYTEIARRMATDTLNDEYAFILRSHAIAAHAKSRYAEAYDYLTRYADLSKAVSDSLHKSEAHEYAARYHAHELQLKIQEKQAEAERSQIISIAIAIFALLAILFALYFFYQKRVVSKKNHALVRMINGVPPELKEEPIVDKSDVDSHIDDNYDDNLFNVIDTAIRTEHLYTNVSLQRQDICDRFGIRRHVLNEMLARHTGGLSFPQYINTIRSAEALRLLRTEPEKNLVAIAAEVGFSPANFREQFKQRYGMTPAEYRQNL